MRYAANGEKESDGVSVFWIVMCSTCGGRRNIGEKRIFSFRSARLGMLVFHIIGVEGQTK